ncbi:MAG: HPF/RaiA family ribosome-associated protein, partial [Burkholderiaceae bacterium]
MTAIKPLRLGLKTMKSIPFLQQSSENSMKLPLQINFHGIDHSPALEAAIAEKSAGLGRFDSSLISCRVTVEQEGRHQHQGREVAIRIDLSVPGHELVVTRKHEDAFAATNEAFD